MRRRRPSGVLMISQNHKTSMLWAIMRLICHSLGRVGWAAQ
jgi:hypothetical protein